MALWFLESTFFIEFVYGIEFTICKLRLIYFASECVIPLSECLNLSPLLTSCAPVWAVVHMCGHKTSQQLGDTPPMGSMLVARMSPAALLFLGLFLVSLAEAAPQDLSMTGPGGEALDCEKMNNGLWAMKE